MAGGEANGHSGVLYDNRDRGHSTLRRGAFPSLFRVRYGPELIDLDRGLAAIEFDETVVIGNASLAITTGPRRRSLTRRAMTDPDLALRTWELAAANHLYIYPEHRDHDAADLYPANWPYTVTTQGSSGSDQPFLDAFAMTLAAFRRDTFEAMREDGVIVPTLQMILRRNLREVSTREDYFTGSAHPVVFDGRSLRPERMIGQAAAITPDEIPPAVRLRVVEEDFGNKAGLAGRSERLFTTPAAIARLWRGFDAEKRMVIAADARGGDPARATRFRWVLLRGDPARVSIIPTASGARAEIVVGWHNAFDIRTPDGAKTTSRVDIGVFAENGGAPSAPAILSVSFPTHQQREYAMGEDGTLHLVSVDYDAAGRDASFDPELYWTAPWRDVPIRDGAGDLTGWRRISGNTERIVPAGRDAPNYEITGAETELPTLVEIAR